jgi:AcrR family transcriptional regulator
MSPRTEEQFEQIREQKTELILNAALELLAHKGYYQTSISDIAKKANISKGLVYNYFESKEALVTAILDKGINELLNIYDPNKDGILESGELRNFIHESFQLIKENLAFWRLYFSISLQPGIFQIVEQKIKELSEPLMKMTAEYFKTMGFDDPGTEAFLFGALLDGISLGYIMNPAEYPIDKIKKVIIDRYCNQNPQKQKKNEND